MKRIAVAALSIAAQLGNGTTTPRSAKPVTVTGL
jgi:hypothetical protein